MPANTPDQFSQMSMLDKLAALGRGGLLQFKHWSEGNKHVPVPERYARELRAPEYGLPQQRVNRNPTDRAINYAGGFDWGRRESVPLEDALDMAKAYQLFDYMTTFDPAKELDAQRDYEENVAGVLAAQPYRGIQRPERELLREAAEYGKRGYADGGGVSPLKIIREELPQFWQGEQAAGMRGMVKGLGDLLGIGSSAEPESVMSRYPSEENAVRSLTPVIAAVAPAARAAAPLARLAMRNPLTTGAALTYATEDPTNLIMNPIALAATYSPEAEAVVKPKGGNWLNSVEKALASLKSARGGPTVAEREADLARIAVADPERYQQLVNDVLPIARRNEAWDNWVGGPLTKYVKTYMGTAEDPVRKLAEQGILHVNPEELNIRRGWLDSDYAKQQLMGKSPEARMWEGVSDLPINPMRTKDLSDLTKLSDPWTTKLGPEEQVYGLLDPQNFGRDLGFQHLKDELRGAMNPNSTLPENLRLKPEDLKQMGMEKAVRHVAAINAWREAQQAEANLAKAMNPATHTVKEYPEGYKMVELKAPDESKFIEEGLSPALAKAGAKDEARKALEEALGYEGEIMGHCVGGYCEDVAKGRSQIFSLRDAKGRPHATIEVRPNPNDPVAEYFRQLPKEEQVRIHEAALGDSSGLGKFKTSSEADANAAKVKSFMLQENPELANLTLPPNIIQIKGKGNKAVPEKYQSMVQDFIRSGDWGDIGDLGNAGLIRGPKGSFMTPSEMLEQFRALPENVRNQGFTRERMKWLEEGKTDYDYQDALDWINRDNDTFASTFGNNYAQGGSVQPAHFDDLDAFLSR